MQQAQLCVLVHIYNDILHHLLSRYHPICFITSRSAVYQKKRMDSATPERVYQEAV